MILSRLVALCLVAILMLATSDGRAKDVVDELRATERERLRSLVNADMQVARRLHADDFQMINPLGGDIDYLEWEPAEVEVKLYGDSAFIFYQARLRIAVRGMP